MSLTAFIAYVRRADQIFANNQSLTDDVIEEAITDALDYYSLRRPRENRRSTIEIAIDDESITLPDDFLIDHEENQSTLFLLTYGYQQPTFRVPGAYPAQRSSRLSPFDSALGATTDPPGTGTSSVPTTIPISRDDNGAPIISLSDAATDARSHDILYTARHIIRDADAEADPPITAANSVPREDRTLLRRLTMYFMAEARQRAATLAATAAEPGERAAAIAVAQEWGRIADRYADAKEECAAGVGFGIWR